MKEVRHKRAHTDSICMKFKLAKPVHTCGVRSQGRACSGGSGYGGPEGVSWGAAHVPLLDLSAGYMVVFGVRKFMNYTLLICAPVCVLHLNKNFKNT